MCDIDGKENTDKENLETTKQHMLRFFNREFCHS